MKSKKSPKYNKSVLQQSNAETGGIASVSRFSFACTNARKEMKDICSGLPPQKSHLCSANPVSSHRVASDCST